MVNYPTSYRRRATGTHAGVRFACWHAPIEALQSGTIGANPRRRRGARVASSRCVGWRSSNPSPCWLPSVVFAADCRGSLRRSVSSWRCRPDSMIAERSTTMPEDHEGFVQNRSLFGKDWATTNPATFVVFDLRLRDAHPVHFPIDVVPS